MFYTGCKTLYLSTCKKCVWVFLIEIPPRCFYYLADQNKGQRLQHVERWHEIVGARACFRSSTQVTISIADAKEGFKQTYRQNKILLYFMNTYPKEKNGNYHNNDLLHQGVGQNSKRISSKKNYNTQVAFRLIKQLNHGFVVLCIIAYL